MSKWFYNLVEIAKWHEKVTRQMVESRLTYLHDPVQALIETLVPGGCQFKQTVILFRRKVIVEIINRVNRTAVFMHFVMAMRAGTFTRTANPPDNITPFYFLTNPGFYTHHMTI
jgi:hypothetical protein